ncbi:hypothetical protein QNH39_15300 [Neobacillus novalis]|uniref:Uncharacterized protein n=1 Tax=Neobacillus novalis TaxID=220687 RepID=A0AA95MJ34_9BACI|nr:hypothetical protein [Neobacillus novalis]WHY84047.1 hypothetical protein QNH39_15300 [Neobacillus novalis]
MITDEQILKKAQQLYDLVEKKWINEIFLSPSWIFIVILIICTYALFLYLVDKKRITVILLYGSLLAVAFQVYDSIGEQLGYWATLKDTLPIKTNYFLGNFTLIPLSGMLVYQYTSSWKSYLFWITVWGGLLAFVFYKLVLQYIKFFVYIKPFSTTIDFLLFLTVGIIVRWIVVSLLKLEEKRKLR